MTKKLTHDEAREILSKGGKVDGHFNEGEYGYNPINFNKEKLSVEDCEGDCVSILELDYFTEHKEPKTFEYWVNVYPGTISGHATRGSADRYAIEEKRLACIKVTGKEGDGL